MTAAILLLAGGLLQVQASQEDSELVLRGDCDIDVDGFLFYVEVHYGGVEPGRAIHRTTTALEGGTFTARIPLPGETPFPGTYVVQITAPLSQPVSVPRRIQREIRRYDTEVEFRLGTDADRDEAIRRTRARLTGDIDAMSGEIESARAVFEGSAPAPEAWSTPLAEISARMQAVEYRLARLDGIAYEANERLGGMLRQIWPAAAERAIPAEQFDAMAQRFDYERQRLMTLIGSLGRGEVDELLDALEAALTQGPDSADPEAARRDAHDLILRLNYRAPGAYERIQNLAGCVGPVFEGDATAQARAVAAIAEMRESLRAEP